MMELTRRGFFKGLLALGATAAVAAPVLKVIEPKVIDYPKRMALEGLNGKWTWINVASESGVVGNFCGRFEIFPKPDESDTFATLCDGSELNVYNA